MKHPLQQYLDETGQTSNKFADKHNLSKVTIWRILREHHTPRPKTAEIIEQATGGLVKKEELIWPNWNK